MYDYAENVHLNSFALNVKSYRIFHFNALFGFQMKIWSLLD